MGRNASLTSSYLFGENLIGKCFDFLISMLHYLYFLFCPRTLQMPNFSLPGPRERDDLEMGGKETQIMVTGG